MAASITRQEDRGFETQSDGATIFTRALFVEGDNLMSIYTSNIIPKRGTRHPSNTVFYLDSVSISPVGNANRKCQAIATLTYSNGRAMISEFKQDPWDLGAQNVNIHAYSVTKPFVTGWDEKGKEIRNVNTAKCAIEAETEKGISEMTFMYCKKASSSKSFDGNLDPIINQSAVTVAGTKIPAKQGLLLPLSAEYVVEYDGDGDEYRKYWNIEGTIRINPEGWADKELNVGTLAKFNGSKPKPIYSYTPWTSADPATRASTASTFGCIDDVIAAKTAYARIAVGSDITPGTETDSAKVTRYWQAWNELPYDEVTEPMPLNDSGELDLAAFQSGEYKTITICRYKTASWSGYNLPRDRA